MGNKTLKQIKKLQKKALEVLNKRERQNAQDTLGVLRGGSSGALADGKSYAAKCARIDQARLLGVQKEPTENERIMFSAGLGHEVWIESMLKDAGVEYVREETNKAQVAGQEWSGRPDFEINLGDRWVGLEAKSLVSNFSVKKQTEANWPFMRHLVQSAAYMAALGRKEWVICIGHYFYAQPHPRTKIEPSVRWYILEDAKDGLHVWNEAGERAPLPFSLEDTKAYYQALIEANEEKRLERRPTEFEIGMNSYNRCNYCHMKKKCDQYETKEIDFDTWIKSVKGDNDDVG